jgi:hypothetical protein
MATEVLRRHPIRGFLYGILFGLGLMFVAVGQGWAALGTWPALIVFVVGVVLATAWGSFGPSKQPKGPPPPEPVEVHATPEPGSRFDDLAPPVDPTPDYPQRPPDLGDTPDTDEIVTDAGHSDGD